MKITLNIINNYSKQQYIIFFFIKFLIKFLQIWRSFRKLWPKLFNLNFSEFDGIFRKSLDQSIWRLFKIKKLLFSKDFLIFKDLPAIKDLLTIKNLLTTEDFLIQENREKAIKLRAASRSFAQLSVASTRMNQYVILNVLNLKPIYKKINNFQQFIASVRTFFGNFYNKSFNFLPFSFIN